METWNRRGLVIHSNIRGQNKTGYPHSGCFRGVSVIGALDVKEKTRRFLAA